jgi:hypothetical protein
VGEILNVFIPRNFIKNGLAPYQGTNSHASPQVSRKNARVSLLADTANLT